ncbi:hypothetical protein BP422_11565 [Brevibacillus formosus]|uniref:Uncharacterized protein n=1 Tax=Brevibacillus formosus TaxID=54913 RepID=A0A220MGI6_9BACL|nr:DUF6886 family protein [Brevibacillus formosus]ASJ54127.1 hypothetical protein BP422_11565 [Brevibacillus formosus]
MDKLFHYSEDPAIAIFQPRAHPSHPTLDPAVWAIDEERAPMYYLPRDCPRICFYKKADSVPADVERFLGLTSAKMVIAIESKWYPALTQTTLYEYTFSPESFYCWDEGAGYYLSKETVTPLDVRPLRDLVHCLSQADIELRITPSLLPLRDSLPQSSLHYSMIRMRNASLT